ncbi:uncharacterized protein LOC142174876 [Nicotiana tabacum]|uniref:Uncharacterized protein LOC142174876 n=1 Tax=Nicotiana tabacum TaxID=4097 RepID=A0AC58TJF6_TOBAC
MTGDKQLFKTIIILDGGMVTFGDKSKGNVIGIGKVPLNSTCDVDEVYLVDELGYNLLNLFGPTRTSSIGGRKYTFVIIDDFSRFTWVIFLSHKDKALSNFEVFYKKVQREKGYYISTIRRDHGGEFENRAFENFYNDQGISHNFSSPKSPQQNRVVEHKNRTLQDMGITTKRSQKFNSHVALISQLEPKKVDEALKDDYLIKAMKDELDQFEKNKVWDFVPKPSNTSILGTKWVFKNKLNKSGQVVCNKARVVSQGYSQQEGIDYDETFVHVARLKSIRILLDFAAHKGFKLFQMNVKRVFLNGYISEEVYVKQPPGFVSDSC